MAIRIQNQRKAPRLPTRRLKAILQTICAGLGFKRCELSLLCTDDATIHELNKTWRQRDKPTDVLSFSQLEGQQGVLLERGMVVLGDVVISMQTAARQAAVAGV